MEERFFITESVRFARSLPYVECLRYLRGLLRTCGDAEELAQIRSLVVTLTTTDAQLELIAGGQLTLNLDPTPKRKRRTR